MKLIIHAEQSMSIYFYFISKIHNVHFRLLCTQVTGVSQVALYNCYLHSLCKISVFLGEHILCLDVTSPIEVWPYYVLPSEKKVQNYVFILVVFNKWTIRTDPINCMKYITGFYWLKCLWWSGGLLWLGCLAVHVTSSSTG